jgi:diguanylate cyclase (GGDEF)-like protein/PAS domain S-box-containing protein
MTIDYDETEQIQATLRDFQAGYIRRDPSGIDEFMQLFVQDKTLEIIGTSALDYLTPKSKRIVKNNLTRLQTQVEANQLVESGTVVLEQYCKDGSTIWTEVRVRPTYDNGNLVGYQGLSRDITQRKVAEDALRKSYGRLAYLATHDPLTNLANRTLFEECLARAIEKTQEGPASLALLMIDLDDFKIVNDTFGHAAGDEVLKEVARRMRSAVRKGDTVCRLAGDEFIVILEQINTEPEAHLVAEKLQQEIVKPIDLKAHTIRIDCSIGIVLYPDHGKNPTDLVQQADRAMYIAKQNGTRISTL